MRSLNEKELEAYSDGIAAAYRSGKYEGFEDIPDCPYPEKTSEDMAWWDGFGDGTEDSLA